MAKQSGGMPKIDEDFMKELISQGVPSKQDNNKTNDVPQETQTETVQVEKPTPLITIKAPSSPPQSTHYIQHPSSIPFPDSSEM